MVYESVTAIVFGRFDNKLIMMISVDKTNNIPIFTLASGACSNDAGDTRMGKS
jgi:hypothetical protein